MFVFSFPQSLLRTVAATVAVLCANWAHATPPSPQPLPAPATVTNNDLALCPEAWEMEAPQLQGQWDVTIDGTPHAATLLLGPHPEWEGTVKGEVVRAHERHPMVGDVDQGNVTLEESHNGTNISATWMGTVTNGSCAREVRGEVQEGDEGPRRSFILRKRNP